MPESDDSRRGMDRRSFLRSVGIGVIGGSCGMLFFDAWLAGDCIGSGKCRSCIALEGGCTLPDALAFREATDHPPADGPARAGAPADQHTEREL